MFAFKGSDNVVVWQVCGGAKDSLFFQTTLLIYENFLTFSMTPS